MKTSLDMEHHEILLTRSCCIPEPERGKVCGLGFLPEHGRGFEAVLKDTEDVILPNLLRT